METGIYKKLRQKLCLLIITILLLTNCAGKLKKAINIARPANLKSAIIKTSIFKLQTFYRIKNRGGPLTIYIEGDGLSWLNRNRPSNNPTPKNPIALRLAALDRNSNVIYIARPCQYVDLKNEENCEIPYWTQKRFSRKIVLAIDEAITIMASSAKSKDIHLVGYSGGGAVVAMIAAKRSDIASLRTVAGYMDHVALNSKAGVSPLTGSLDPIKAAHRLKLVPQIHYSGKGDTRVPGWVLKNFRKAVGSSDCIKLRQVKATHEEGWEEIWKRVWSKIPTCR